MSNIYLSKDFQTGLMKRLEGLFSADLIFTTLNQDPIFINLVKDLKKILSEDKYVLIKGLPAGTSQNRDFFAAFVRMFGEYYGTVEFTGIKIDCHYTGCSRNALTLHNDDAIDLLNQPKYGFIQVIRNDPLFEVENGVVLIRELVRLLKFEQPDLLQDLLTKPIPMLSYGVNFESNKKEELICHENILLKTDTGYKVRFDFDRNRYYYQVKKIKQSYAEAKMIYDFLQWANKVKKNIFLDKGDVLILDNHETLHDRGECSVAYEADGSINSREIFVSFVR